MKRNTRNSYVLMAAGAAALLLGGGVAFAFWTSSGTGTGTAAAATTDSVDITQVGSISGLYPDGPGQTISIDIANPNDSDVSIGDVTATVSGTDKVGCTADDFAISGPVYGGGTIIGGGSQAASGATIRMVNDPLRNQDACKGAVVSLAFSAASS